MDTLPKISNSRSVRSPASDGDPTLQRIADSGEGERCGLRRRIFQEVGDSRGKEVKEEDLEREKEESANRERHSQPGEAPGEGATCQGAGAAELEALSKR